MSVQKKSVTDQVSFHQDPGFGGVDGELHVSARRSGDEDFPVVLGFHNLALRLNYIGLSREDLVALRDFIDEVLA